MHFYRRLLILCSISVFIIFFVVKKRHLIGLDKDLSLDIFDDVEEEFSLDNKKQEIAEFDTVMKIKNYVGISAGVQLQLLETSLSKESQSALRNLESRERRTLYAAIPLGEAFNEHAHNEDRLSRSLPNTGAALNDDVKPLRTMSCNQECQTFQRSLESWPVNKPKAAIYYLTQSNRLDVLKTSLNSIERYFNSLRQYPIIIFHESDLDSKVTREEIRSYVKTPVFFQLISFDIPSFVNWSAVTFNISCLSHIGYRHMCRFHALGVYQQPIFQGLDYVWRLDDDSILLGDVTYDVFETMKEGQFLYGYKIIHWDSLACTEGLWPATSKYIETKGIKAEFFADWPVARIYYNNFEISALSLWKSEQYQDYINYIDHLGGIFYHRWGDAPIKSLAVSMFVPRRRTHWFSDVQYKHTSFFNNSFRRV